MPARKSAACLILVLLALTTIALWLNFPSDANAAVSVGQEAPALVIADLNGHTFDLHALRGKTVIIAFWASWCAPCLKEVPELSSFYRHTHAKGVEMIAVSVDRPHDKGAVQKIAATASYPVGIASSTSVIGFDNPDYLPITYIIDTKGTVRTIFSEGPVTEESLFEAVFH